MEYTNENHFMRWNLIRRMCVCVCLCITTAQQPEKANGSLLQNNQQTLYELIYE